MSDSAERQLKRALIQESDTMQRQRILRKLWHLDQQSDEAANERPAKPAAPAHETKKPKQKFARC
jgi:hypothetical protein